MPYRDPKAKQAYNKTYVRSHLAVAAVKRRTSTTWLAWYLQKTYKLTLAEYHAMLQVQGDACAICRRMFAEFKRRPCIDHDHKTGRVRGLLCGPCNSGLGAFREKPEVFDAAKRYLGFTS